MVQVHPGPPIPCFLPVQRSCQAFYRLEILTPSTPPFDGTILSNFVFTAESAYLVSADPILARNLREGKIALNSRRHGDNAQLIEGLAVVEGVVILAVVGW